MYGVNSVDNLSVILKDDLRKLIFKELGCISIDKLTYILERNQSFLFDCKSKTIDKFKDISPDLTKEDLGKHFINEIKQKSTYYSSTSLSEKCRHLFGR